MAHRLSLWNWVLMAFVFLPGCSSYSPPDRLIGLSQNEVIAKMGQPDLVRKMSDGTRLEFPRGPFGKHTWFVYFDTAGHASRAEQVLTEKNFMQINPGMTEEDVRQLLGRPNQRQGLARERGTVWSYRYVNSFCQWFQIELTAQQEVRSAGYGPSPECNHHVMGL